LSEVDTTDGNLYFVQGFQQKRLDLAHIFPDVNWDEVDYTIATINQRKGFQYTIGTYALIAIVFFILTFLMTKERVHPPKHQKTTIKQDLKDLVSNKPWIIVGVMSLFTLGQVCIRNGAIMYYFKYFVGNTGYAKYFMVVGTAFNLLGVLCTDWLVRIIGSKKRVYFITMVGNGIFLISFFFLNSGQLALMFIVQLLSGFLSGPQAPLVWAMYADTADYSEWKKGTRATGLFFSAATFAQKMGWTLGGALAGWLLAIFGFKANVTQTAETILGIKLLMSMIPALPSILAGVMVLFYKLDKDFMIKIENDLKQRRKQSESK
ncbi:MAG: MFS transporter, partial [bacterium]